MKMEDFNNLEPQNFGNWPIPVKALIIIVLCIAALFAGYWFDTQNQIVDLTKIQGEEKDLKKKFKNKQKQAATLPKLEEQMVQIESILKELLRKLPNKSQVDKLIRGISQTVLANGLKEDLFQPLYNQQKKEKDVYTMLPIKLMARGNYHAFGKFISGVAAMNRIVTQHNIAIKFSKTASKQSSKYALTLNMTARIYSYIEDKPDEQNAKK